MNIVLHQPEIPLNTGNIGRTCVATNSTLHLIHPCGFFMDDKAIKRAGLDYWSDLDVREYDDFDGFIQANPDATIYMATTKAKQNYAQVNYHENDFIMFGKESGGIPESILKAYEQTMIRIPMFAAYRSLNLSNAVSIVLYEALRQNAFKGLGMEGEFHHSH